MKKPWLIICLFVIVSCGQNARKIAKKGGTEAEDKVHFFSPDNKDMNAAIAEAARTWPEFERALAGNDPSLSQFTVKMEFRYDNGDEHMWLSELHTKNGNLHGVLDSEPMYIENLAYGDTVQIKKETVSDWFYVKNGKLVGGYTIRVMYNNLSEEEKKEFKATFPFQF